MFGKCIDDIYYWHKVKHIPFVNFAWDFGTLTIKSFDTFQDFIIHFGKKTIYQQFNEERIINAQVSKGL